MSIKQSRYRSIIIADDIRKYQLDAIATHPLSNDSSIQKGRSLSSIINEGSDLMKKDNFTITDSTSKVYRK